MTNGDRILEAHVLDATTWLRVDELCARVHVERHWIVELVDLGALEPVGGNDPGDWTFALSDVPRVHAMTRLVEDLGVNLPGAAIILELAEERRRLLAQLQQWSG
ncbi:MAG TPA: chaperone modulator CbpM [Steroidobacteraceae bacterium]